MKNKTKDAIEIAVIYLLAMFAMSVWSYVFISYAALTTNPEFMWFLGLLPWFVSICTIAIAAVDTKNQRH